MHSHWFVPKSYGWGFVPVTWQGWVMTCILIGLLLLSAKSNGFFDETVTEPQLIRFILDVVFGIGVFSYFAERKTKGDVRWHWGK